MALLAGSFLKLRKGTHTKGFSSENSRWRLVSSINLYQWHAFAFGKLQILTVQMIVVLHGGPGVDYRSLLNAKDLKWRLFRCLYDQRNTGLSRRHPKSSLHIQQTIDDLSAVIQHYKDQRIRSVFTGTFLGAMLATEYINTYPTQIAGVVLAEPGGFTWEQTKSVCTEVKTIKCFWRNSEWRDIYRSVYQFRWKWSAWVGLQTRNSLCEWLCPGNTQREMRDLIHSGVSVQQSSTRWMKMPRRTDLISHKICISTQHLFYLSTANWILLWRTICQRSGGSLSKCAPEMVRGTGHEIVYFLGIIFVRWY